METDAARIAQLVADAERAVAVLSALAAAPAPILKQLFHHTPHQQ